MRRILAPKKESPKQKAPGPATARLSLYLTSNYVWNARLVRHRGNTRKRSRSTIGRFCQAVCSQTTPLWKSAYLVWILEPLFMSRRAAKTAWFSAGKNCLGPAILSSSFSCPSLYLALPGRPPVLSSLSQLAPITQNNPAEVLSVCKAKKLKIFSFFSIDGVFYALAPHQLHPHAQSS